MTMHDRHHERRRGIALLLVLFAVAMSTVLSLSFISAQGTTTSIAQTAQHHGQARLVAESAMKMVIEYIAANDDWRMDFTSGTWMSNQSLAGGTFSVTGVDGSDTDGDGDIDGDGDLDDDDEDPVTLTVTGYFDGRSHVVRAVVAVDAQTTGGGGPTHGIGVSAKIKMKNSARIDAVNSATTTYNPAVNSSTAASIATNSTANDQIEMSNSATVVGNAYIGVGGVIANVFDFSGSAQVTGAKANLSANLTIPAVPTLAPMPSSSGSYTSPNSGSTTFSTNRRYSSFTLKNSYIINISGNVVIYCDGKFETDNSAELRLSSGATLVVYANEYVFKNASKFNMTSPPTPDKATLYMIGSNKELQVDNSAQVAAKVLAPNNKLMIKNSGRLFGNFQGSQIELDNSGRFTQDIAITSNGGGGAASTTYTYTVTWSEQP